MSNKGKNILRALVEGKELVGTISGREDRLKLNAIIVISASGIEKTITDMAEFEDMEIYIDPKDAEIQRLSEIIARQGEEIEKLVASKTTQVVRRPRLTKAVVKDIEVAIDKKVSPTQIMNTYEISSSTYSRILNHRHALSTPIVKEDDDE